MDSGDLNDNLRLVEAGFGDEGDHAPLSRTFVADPGTKGPAGLDVGQLLVLKKRHAFLNEYSDEILCKTPIETLLKLEATSIKLKNLEKGTHVEDRLTANREGLSRNIIEVQAGQDDRWHTLHEARFLPGAACSSAKLWLRAREVIGTSGQAAVSVYDMASVGLAGHVTPKGWEVLGDPGSSAISINLFSISNCGKRVTNKSSGLDTEELKEIAELGELKVAIRALREALGFVQPWNKSVSALEGVLIQSNFCATDLEGVDQQAQLLSSFVDYVLRENSNRWRGQEPFMGIPEVKGAWESFLGSRPQAMLARSKKQAFNYRPYHRQQTFQGYQQPAQPNTQPQQQQGGVQPSSNNSGGGQGQNQNKIHVPAALWWEDICVMYNIGKCLKPPGTCTTKKGRPLRHICNHRPDKNNQAVYCGLPHAACFFH